MSMPEALDMDEADVWYWHAMLVDEMRRDAEAAKRWSSR